MKKLVLGHTVAIVAVLAVAASPALAGGTQHRVALDAQSRTNGMGRRDVPLLWRQAGPGREAAAYDLLSRLPSPPHGGWLAQRVVRGTDVLRMIGDGWHLRVEADGTALRWLNHEALTNAIESPAYPTEPPPVAGLEASARALLRTLAARVPVSRGEALVLFRVRHRVHGAEREGSGVRTEQVVATELTFSRTVGGVDVVGEGSKVRVMFGNDGVVYGLAYDWPVYTVTTQRQALASVAEIEARSGALFDLPGAASNPLTDRFECGYVDIGADRADPAAPIQAGCYVHTSVFARVGDDVLVSAARHVIPAGTSPSPDIGWPGGALECVPDSAGGCQVQLTPAVVPAPSGP